MNDDELIAMISQMVLGYREGKPGDIIQAVASLKSKAHKHEQNINVEKLFGFIDDLAEKKAEILEGA